MTEPGLSEGEAPARVGWLAAIAVAAAVVLPLTLFGPAELFARNSGEFSVSLGEIYLWLVPAALAGTALLALLVRLLPVGPRTWAVAVLLALAAALYAQSHLLVWDYGQFDGTGIDWASHQWHGRVDLALWIGLPILALLARRPLARNAGFVAGVLLAVQLVNAGIAVRGKDVGWFASGLRTVDPGLFELSSENNAIVIVLDAFATPVFDKVIERRPSLAGEFRGFTYFRDSISVLTTTWMSIPAMLTGQVYRNERPAEAYFSEEFEEQSLVNALRAQNVRTNLVTLDRYCERLRDNVCITPGEVVVTDRGALRFAETVRLADLVAFRYLPQAAKRQIYSDEQMLLTHWLAPIQEGINWHLSESLGVVNLMQERLHVGDDRPAFKFLHLMVPHHPYHLDRNCEALPKAERDDNAGGRLFVEQGECAVRLTARLLQKLRDLGVYDQSSIVVVADHGWGQRRYYRSARGFGRNGVERALGLMLVKPRGAGGPMRTSSAPATNADVARTVAALMEVPSDLPGRNVMALGENERRTRHYYHYVWRGGWWGSDYLPPIQEYILRGDPRNPRAWREGEKIPVNGKMPEN